MPITMLDNHIHIKQTAPAAAVMQSQQHARFDLQAFNAMEEFNDKEEEIEEIRPTEESHQVDPDQEHERQREDMEQQRSEKRKREEEEEVQEQVKLGHLDIKV